MLKQLGTWLPIVIMLCGCRGADTSNSNSRTGASGLNTTIVDDSFDEQFVGEWEIQEYDVAYEIHRSDNVITFTGRDATDGEEFEVTDVTWDGSQLSATLRMPSTGQTTHSTLTVVNSDVLRDDYTGDAAGSALWSRKGTGN